MANLEKFQFMILSKTTVNHAIEILALEMPSSKSMKLFRLTIGKKLNFDIHINDLCKVTNTNFKDLRMIWKGLYCRQECFTICLSCF